MNIQHMQNSAAS